MLVGSWSADLLRGTPVWITTLTWPQRTHKLDKAVFLHTGHVKMGVRGTLNREGASKHLDDGAVKVVFSEHGGVDGGRHEDDADLWVGLDHISQDHHQEVRLSRHTGNDQKHTNDSNGTHKTRTPESEAMSTGYIQ